MNKFILLGAMIGGIAGGITISVIRPTPKSTQTRVNALDRHCQLMRTQLDWLRKDIWKNQHPDSLDFSYREIAFHDFENVTMCMEKDDMDPVFQPQFCDTGDKACILNQIDILLISIK